jgi:acetolactate synthase-1/3 small subunit
VDDISAAPSIVRDLALIKVTATGEARTHVMQLVDVYRARVVDVSPDSLIIETTGTEDKIDSLLEVLRPFGVLEMVRTGRIAMARGKRAARTVEALPENLIADDVSIGSV